MGYTCLFQFWLPQGSCLGIPCLGIAESYAGFIPSFLKNLNTVFNSGCINLHSHQLYKSIPFSPHPIQHLLFLGFLMMGILTSVRWYLIVVLIYISLIMNNDEHLFMCLLAIISLLYNGLLAIISSLKKYLYRSFSHFFIGLFAFLGLSSMHCFYILEINPLSVVSFAIIFFHSEGCLFTLLIASFAMQKLLSLIRSD